MIVTIDGPAGAGKSTGARMLAQRLGFDYLDTGAMYRAVALAALRAEIDPSDEPAMKRLLEGISLEMIQGKVLLNDEDVSSLIRAPEISAGVGPVASSQVVRQQLVEWQRKIAQGRNIICEGRDQGTVVFPEAACKFFLLADPRERARRRLQEMQDRGEPAALEEVLQALEIRDRGDAARQFAPMVPAADATILDSTRLTLEQVVEEMYQAVQRKM